jgi:dephospho-CoA kinase
MSFLKIGLTGGIGMGKSAAATWLQNRGVPVVDTDQLAHDLVEPGRPALAEIIRVFGDGIIDEQGRLRRGELARRVFACKEDRLRLESILHPPIQQAWKDQCAMWERQGKPLAVVVIPLLFETHAERELDRVICVACPAAVQNERLSARGWDAGHIAARCAAQWPVTRKMQHSDYVVWNDAGLEVMAAQLAMILDRCGVDQARAGGRSLP